MCRRQNAGMALQATAGTPRPWTCFGVAAGLLARRSSSPPKSSQCDTASVTSGSGGDSLLTVAGAAPGFRGCGSPASLLATKSCDMADRDTHMWYQSQESVNDGLIRNCRLPVECGGSLVAPSPIGDLLRAPRQSANRIRSIHEQPDLFPAVAEKGAAGCG
jgi:hypothetical protein